MGFLVLSLAQWMVIVVLARYGSPSMVGQYAFGLAVSAPVIGFASLALRTVQVTDTGTDAHFIDYLGLRMTCMFAAVAVIAGAALVMESRSTSVALMIGVAKALDGVGDIYFGLFQRNQMIANVAFSMIINGVTSVVAVVLMLAITGSVLGAVAGSVFGSALGSVIYCSWSARHLGGSFRAAHILCGTTNSCLAIMTTLRRIVRHWYGLTRIAWPLGFSLGVASLSSNLTRYAIEHWLGAATLGVFAALGYVVIAANTVWASVAQTMLPKMTKLYFAGESEAFVRLTKRLVVASLSVGAVAVFLSVSSGEIVLNMIYGAPYAKYASILTLLTVAAAISGVAFFSGIALSASRRFGNQLAASVATLAVGSLSAVLLVPHYGLPGAAWAAILGIASEGATKSAMLRRVLRNQDS